MHILLVNRDPVGAGLDADRLKADPLEARASAGAHEQPVAPQVRTTIELQDILVPSRRAAVACIPSISSRLTEPGCTVVGYYRQAITAYEEAGDHLGTARALASLAAAETELGYYDEAAEHLRLALPACWPPTPWCCGTSTPPAPRNARNH